MQMSTTHNPILSLQWILIGEVVIDSYPLLSWLLRCRKTVTCVLIYLIFFLSFIDDPWAPLRHVKLVKRTPQSCRSTLWFRLGIATYFHSELLRGPAISTARVPLSPLLRVVEGLEPCQESSLGDAGSTAWLTLGSHSKFSLINKTPVLLANSRFKERMIAQRTALMGGEATTLRHALLKFELSSGP